MNVRENKRLIKKRHEQKKKKKNKKNVKKKRPEIIFALTPGSPRSFLTSLCSQFLNNKIKNKVLKFMAPLAGITLDFILHFLVKVQGCQLGTLVLFLQR